MTKTVNIVVTGFQREVDDEPTVEISTGTYGVTDGRHFLRFDHEGVHNLIKFSEGYALIQKTGTVSSRLEFILGDSTRTIYSMPYGDFELMLTTSEISCIETDNEVKLLLKYDLNMNGSHVSECELSVNITSM